MTEREKRKALMERVANTLRVYCNKNNLKQIHLKMKVVIGGTGYFDVSVKENKKIPKTRIKALEKKYDNDLPS